MACPRPSVSHLRVGSYTSRLALDLWRCTTVRSASKNADADKRSPPTTALPPSQQPQPAKPNELVVEAEAKRSSYFGYLSGVVSTLWNPAQQIIQSGQDFLTSDAKDAKGNRKPSAPIAAVAAAAATVANAIPSGSQSPPAKKARAVKTVSRQEVLVRTKMLLRKLNMAESTSSRVMRTEELNRHLALFPASRSYIIQEHPQTIAQLFRQLSAARDVSLKGETRVCLALCGCIRPPQAAGIRVLAIDGGGTRGMMGLAVLGELERKLGGCLTDHFDLIAGVSTGAIIASLLVARRMKVREAKDYYMEISRQLFNQTRLSGVSGLLLSHSWYNTKKWVEILKASMIDTARDESCTRLAIISCLVNARQLQPFVFRNYEHPVGRDSYFRGSTRHKLWQAIQASAAAPGYFEEVILDSMIHQDGGVLTNNPSAIALHEARLLWPHEKIQCVVSVGNGRSVTELEITNVLRSTSLQDKLSKIVDSATDTELVHMSMTDLLDPRTYFRLNPYMSQPYTLDEVDADKLQHMHQDAQAYVRRNRLKIRGAALQLARPAPLLTSARRALKQWRNRHAMYKPD